MICPRCGFDNLPGNDDCSRCLLDLAQLEGSGCHDRVHASLIADRVSILKPRPAVTIGEGATIRNALTIMNDNGVGALMVVMEDGRLSGILTERDVLLRAADLYPNGFDGQPASNFMTAHPVTVTAEDSIARALQKMDVGGYRHLPVVESGKPVGMISVRDLVRHITSMCKE